MDIEYNARVASSVATVRQRMAQACERAHRPSSSVVLLAVTKLHPIESVYAAYDAGIRFFGENRVQEAELKFKEAEDALAGSSLHMLGHLQSNKVKKALALFDCVQSVDTESLIIELARRAEAMGIRIDILFELHTGEESKIGFKDEETLFKAIALASQSNSLNPRGIMTMAPYTQDTALIRNAFKTCAAAFMKARLEFDLQSFDTLSMGMSNDFEIAIEEGSTLVRVGTAIFGER